MTEEQQIWQDFVTSPGFLLFKAEAKKRWGPEGYGRQLKVAVSTAIQQQASADAAIKAVDFANNEINALMSYPTDRLKQIAAAVEAEQGVPLVSRRGPNL